MSYPVTLNGKRFEIPDYTLAVAEKSEELQADGARYNKGEISTREFSEKEIAFLTDTIGEDNVKALLGSLNVEEVELKRLDDYCTEVLIRYIQESNRTQSKMLKAKTEPVTTMLNDSKVSAALHAVKK